MTIGERIKERRKALKLSQRDLAKKIGYADHSTITKIEAGKVDLPQSKIVQFAEVLSVSVAYIMGWEEEIQKNPEEMAERHIEILMNEDISDIFEDFISLDEAQKKIVKDLVHNLAKTKKAEV